LDRIFEDFKSWIDSKKDKWEKQDLIIDNIIESTHAHQIHVNLHAKVGVGHIGLFESNNIYWVEFEAVAREFENFYKHFEFNELPCFNSIEEEYLYFLTSGKSE